MITAPPADVRRLDPELRRQFCGGGRPEIVYLCGWYAREADLALALDWLAWHGALSVQAIYPPDDEDPQDAAKMVWLAERAVELADRVLVVDLGAYPDYAEGLAFDMHAAIMRRASNLNRPVTYISAELDAARPGGLT